MTNWINKNTFITLFSYKIKQILIENVQQISQDNFQKVLEATSSLFITF